MLDWEGMETSGCRVRIHSAGLEQLEVSLWPSLLHWVTRGARLQRMLWVAEYPNISSATILNYFKIWMTPKCLSFQLKNNTIFIIVSYGNHFLRHSNSQISRGGYLCEFFLSLGFQQHKPIFYPSRLAKANPWPLYGPSGAATALLPAAQQPRTAILFPPPPPPETSARNAGSSETDGKLQNVWPSCQKSPCQIGQ